MLQVTKAELEEWRSQFVTSNPGTKMGLRRAPYAFTEQRVAMLSSVLRSKRAVAVNIEIMRAFVRLREMLARHAELARRLAELEKEYDGQFRTVFEAIRQLMAPPAVRPKRRIGFHVSAMPVVEGKSAD
jgi:ORF6N domain